MEQARSRRGAGVESSLGLSLGSVFGSLLGVSFRRLQKAKEMQKKCVLAHTVVKFWVLGSSLEGLPGAQKRHPESADSSGDLLKNCLKN